MKKFIALVVMLCAVVISSTATAANWNLICKDVDSNEYFIDYSSISLKKKQKEDFQFSVLIKIVYSEFGRAEMNKRLLPPQLINFASYEINRVLFRLKKSQRAWRSEGGAIFAADGTILRTTSHFYEFLKFNQSSVYWPLFNAAYSHL